MARDRKYHVKVRTHGEPWQTTWSGPGEAVATEAARALFRETRAAWDSESGIVTARVTLPVHPYVRVVCGGVNVLDLGPKDRKRAS